MATKVIDQAFKQHLGLALKCNIPNETAQIIALQYHLPSTSQQISLTKYNGN